MISKLSIEDLNLKEKKALLRVDFNVPLNKDGTISDNTRIVESLPSIEYVLSKEGSVILMGHLGRPKNGPDPKLSLHVCAKELEKLLGKKVIFSQDCIGHQTEELAKHLKPGDILLLENLRFYPSEDNPDKDPSFAEKLAKLGDVYINDAFGSAHRKHSSTATITRFFPNKSACGFLMQKEINYFSKILSSPERPFYAIIGGAKVSSKIGVLSSLLSKVDAIFIGGGMSYTFFKAQGIDIGNSIFEPDCLTIAKEFLENCKFKKIPCHLPKDIVIANRFDNLADNKIISIHEGIPEGWEGMDMGPETTKEWKKSFENGKTFFWNGPVGVFEFPNFAIGTREIAKALSQLHATTIVGGGDSVSAINGMGLSEKFSHLSTGGGASLEFIEYGHLPGVDALSNKAKNTM